MGSGGLGTEQNGGKEGGGWRRMRGGGGGDRGCRCRCRSSGQWWWPQGPPRMAIRWLGYPLATGIASPRWRGNAAVRPCCGTAPPPSGVRPFLRRPSGHHEGPGVTPMAIHGGWLSHDGGRAPKVLGATMAKNRPFTAFWRHFSGLGFPVMAGS